MHAVRDPRIDFFENLAKHWDRDGQSPDETVERVGQLADLLSLVPGQTILEVGCGTGQLTGWLAEQVAPGRVVAIDFAPAMVAQAQAKGIPAEFRIADVCQEAPGLRCYDLALCFHSFPHFRDRHAALLNLGRALKPGGRLLVMHLCGSAAINAFHTGVGGAVAGDHLPDAAEWPPLLDAAGLKLVSLTDRDDLFLMEAVTESGPGD